MDNVSIELYMKAVSEIASEVWRFRRPFERAMRLLDDKSAQKTMSQYAWLAKSVEASLNTVGLRIINIEGQEYNTGMAVSALNLGDFEPNESLIVEQMIEPIIMIDDKVQKIGVVVLGRAKA